MATTKYPGIESYDTASGARYRVRYRKPNGASTDKRGFKTLRDARTFQSNVSVDKTKGQYVDPTAGRVTVSDLKPAWRRKKDRLKPSHTRNLDMAWRVYVEPMWGNTPVSDITADDVEAWIEDLIDGKAPAVRDSKARDTLSASSVLRCIGVLAGILDDAVRQKRIHGNPARGVENRPRKESKKTRRYLTDAEVAQLVDAISDRTRSVLVAFLAYTGLRWGEAIGLRVRDLNMLRKRVTVSVNAVEMDAKIVPGSPKSWEQRTVPIPGFLLLPLGKLCEDKNLDDLVFDRGGDYMRQPGSTHSWFLTALSTAGIERLTPHDLRHTAASLAISSGAHVKAVQRMLGHKSAAMTLDTYADLFDSDLDDVANRLHERAAGAGVGKAWANALES